MAPPVEGSPRMEIKGQADAFQTVHRGDGLDHLHQGQYAFIQPRPSGTAQADKGDFFFNGQIHRPFKFFPEGHTHGAAAEVEFGNGQNDRLAEYLGFSGD